MFFLKDKYNKMFVVCLPSKLMEQLSTSTQVLYNFEELILYLSTSIFCNIIFSLDFISEANIVRFSQICLFNNFSYKLVCRLHSAPGMQDTGTLYTYMYNSLKLVLLVFEYIYTFTAKTLLLILK